jgi:hypothetical protein
VVELANRRGRSEGYEGHRVQHNALFAAKYRAQVFESERPAEASVAVAAGSSVYVGAAKAEVGNKRKDSVANGEA